METKPLELSEEGKKQLEEITLAVFHNFAIDMQMVFARHMASTVSDYLGMQSHATQNVIEQMNAGNRQAQGVPNNV